MNTWLVHPAVQAGVAPFLVALVIAWPLARTRWLALVAGGAMVVLLALTVGFGFTPLTSMRKATLLILAAVGAALALEAAGIGRRRSAVAAVAVIAALTAVWVLQRIVEQAEGAAAWRVAIGAAAFVFAITAGALWASADALRASVIGAALGWGSGALGILAASVFLGQAGIALGTACAAAALALLLRGASAAAGWSLALPAALGAALVGVLAVALGGGRAPALLPLLLVAPAVHWVDRADARPWPRALRQGAAALVPIVVAVVWAWHDAALTQPPG